MPADLVATLESPLPATLPVGAGTAVFCYGTCFHRRARIASIALVADGVRHPPAAARMPRPDVYREAGSFRSGFWGTVPIPARERRGRIELALAARLAGGGEEVAPLGAIEVVAPPPAPPPAGPGLIAVCMATFDPDPALLRAQIASLRAQTDTGWRCVISDDHSSPERYAQMLSVLDGDERFTVSRSERRLGFYRNFERALRMPPGDAQLLALCDQDDRWRPDKLAVLRAALGGATLVYSDQRLVDADGRVLRDTLWRGRRNNHSNLASLLVANTITGAATLFRREVAELALPFPDTPGLQFHDHWLGLVALAAGDVAYVDRPLYDYVQHAGAVFGEVSGGGPDPGRGARGGGREPARGPLGGGREPARGPLGGGRGAYFLGFAAREVQAQALLVRCGDRLTAAKRRALRLYIASQRSPLAFAWLLARPLRALAGRTETLGSEVELARGIAWRWLIALLAVGARRPGRRPCDASFPAPLSFEQRRLRRWRARS